MLSLQLGQTFVDTVDADIPVVLRSPLFASDDGKLPGSFIFNFTIPLTDELKRELAFAHRPARKGKPQLTHPFSLRFGPLHYQGTAQITQLNEKEIEVSMPVDNGDLAVLLKDKSLKDLDIDETIEFEPHISFAFYDQSSYYSYQNISPTNTVLKPGIIRIDTYSGFDIQTGEWACPADGTYNIRVIINWSFYKRAFNGEEVDAGSDPKFLIFKNGSPTLYVSDIESKSFLFEAPISLQEGDVLSFIFQAKSKFFWPVYWLQFYIESGTSITIDNGLNPFENIAYSSFPDNNFALFPMKNPIILENLPDSLYRVDINDLKEKHKLYSPILNNYRNNCFPLVVSGIKDGIYNACLNIFSPAPYIAHIVNKILALINFSGINNPFITNELKQLVYYSNYFINNYFYDGDPIRLIDFIPDEKISEFFPNLCKTLGIVFDAKTTNRSLRFKFVDDIMSDMTSIEFSENVLADIKLKTEAYSGYILKFSPLQCEYLQNYNKSLSGLNIIGQTNFVLPASANVNDAIYVILRQAWYVWQYDPDQGVFQWIFHSIDFPQELKDVEEGSGLSLLEFNFALNTAAMSAWFHSDKEAGAFDNSIGAPENRFWRIPMFYQPGVFSKLPDAYKTELQGILLFYHGLQKDSLDEDYPLGSNTVHDYAGEKISGADLSLRLDGQYGLYEKKWKKFIQWRLSSPGEFIIMKYITALEIHKLDWFRWHKIHGVDYLLKEIRFNITSNRIGVAEIRAHRR